MEEKKIEIKMITEETNIQDILPLIKPIGVEVELWGDTCEIVDIPGYVHTINPDGTGDSKWMYASQYRPNSYNFRPCVGEFTANWSIQHSQTAICVNGKVQMGSITKILRNNKLFYPITPSDNDELTYYKAYDIMQKLKNHKIFNFNASNYQASIYGKIVQYKENVYYLNRYDPNHGELVMTPNAGGQNIWVDLFDPGIEYFV